MLSDRFKLLFPEKILSFSKPVVFTFHVSKTLAKSTVIAKPHAIHNLGHQTDIPVIQRNCWTSDVVKVLVKVSLSLVSAEANLVRPVAGCELGSDTSLTQFAEICLLRTKIAP